MGLGNRLWEGTNRTLCTRAQEKGAVTPQETDPDLPGSAQECPAEAWVAGGLLQGWGTERNTLCMGPSEGGPHYHYLHHSLASGQITRWGTQTHPSTESRIKDLLRMAPPIRTRPSFPLSQSIPSGSFISLLSFSIRGQRNENHNHRKLTNLITRTTALFNSMKL